MRIRVIALSTAVLLLGTAAIGYAGAPQPSDDRDATRYQVDLIAADGSAAGTVTLTQHDEGVEVDASLAGLEPGFHGFHVHETGVCDPDAPDGPFTTAGGHYVGDGGQHGDHAGDLPSLYVTEEGTAELRAVTDAFTLDELITNDGSAVMVHSGPDNFANIPDRYTSSLSGETGPDSETLSTGDSGTRVACGVLNDESGGGTVEPGAGLVTVDSDRGFHATVRRIRRDIRRSDLTLVTVVDHARNARRAGLRLPPTTLFIFGNAESGTPLMQQSRSIAIDLPQKLLVWREGGRTMVTYNDPHYLADRHGITGEDERLDQIAASLQRLASGRRP